MCVETEAFFILANYNLISIQYLIKIELFVLKIKIVLLSLFDMMYRS